MASEFELPTEPQGVVPWLEERLEKGRRRQPRLAWQLNLAYVLGHQWVTYDGSADTLRPVRVRPDDDKVRITVNKIAPLVEQAVARLTQTAPIPECRPVGNDETDVRAARVGTRILASELYRLNWLPFLDRLMMWVVSLGHAYIEVGWDADTRLPSGEEGAIYLDVVTPFDLIVDPNADSLDEARWAIKTAQMTPEAVWEIWGVDVPDATRVSPVLSTIAGTFGGVRRTETRQEEMVEVHQFWLRPGSRIAEQGLVVTWCGSTILDEPRPYPYMHERLPFIQVDFLPGLGTREGRTWVSDLLWMQTDYNDARSREAHLRRVMTPKFLAPLNSMDPRRFGSKAEVIPYIPTAGEPKWLTPQGGWWAQHELVMQRSTEEMTTRAGSSGQSILNMQGLASMPAASLLSLQEQEAMPYGIPAKNLANGIRQMGWHILMLAQQFWTDERLVRTWSEEGELIADFYRGADIASNLDVHVSAESAVPRSKAARVQLAMQLQQMGLFPDPRLFLRMLDLPNVDFLITHLNVDAKQAQRELSRMLAGEQVQVNTFDNHAVHVAEHDLFRKSAEYERLPDEIKAIIDAHVQVHQSMQAMALGMPTTPGPTVPPDQMPPVPGTPFEGADPTRPRGTPPGTGVPTYARPDTGRPSGPTDQQMHNAPNPVEAGKLIERARPGGQAGQ